MAQSGSLRQLRGAAKLVGAAVDAHDLRAGKARNLLHRPSDTTPESGHHRARLDLGGHPKAAIKGHLKTGQRK